jgi:hypothetical protein
MISKNSSHKDLYKILLKKLKWAPPHNEIDPARAK